MEKNGKIQRIGVYGGTFNPIHLGHLHLAEAVQKALHFDRILFVPARVPPHKQAVDLAPGKDRLEMVRLAVQSLPGAMVSDLELKTGGKSYTFFTLQKLKALLPQGEFTLLMGADMLLTFDQWFRWREILSMARLAVAARYGGEQETLAEKAAALSPGGRITVVPVEPLPMSSTEIRLRIQRGEDPAGLLPEAVWAYIQAHGLYGPAKK